eukprot:849137-Pelagomonas_calceolata.AAC.5
MQPPIALAAPTTHCCCGRGQPSGFAGTQLGPGRSQLRWRQSPGRQAWPGGRSASGNKCANVSASCAGATV